jgi:hypothetical protein
MTKVRRLSPEGIQSFKAWLEHPDGLTPSADLLDGADYTEVAYDILVDPKMTFATRYAFGEYLNNLLGQLDFRELMREQNDGLWAWFAVLYFSQLSAKGKRRSEHYLVTRKGLKGSLAYRQAARSCYELVHIHGEESLVCLSVGIHTFGDMAEQLTSRQKLAHNRAFFRAAYDLYVSEGRVRRRANSYPRPAKKRKLGDQTGLGGARRLEVALKRLDLTFDTEVMDSAAVIAVLPQEFKKWQATTTGN